MDIMWLSIIGLTAGVLAGMFGIGGGILIVPALILLLDMPSHTATGTSLIALLLPVGMLGVINHYQSGTISGEHIRFGLILALGLFFGTYLGSKISISLPRDLLQRFFAVFLFILSLYMFFKK